MSERTGILFVCSGNSCRSPIAEYLLRHELERRGLADLYEVRSAGTLGIEGAPATDEAVTVIAERNLDAGGHRSRGLTRELIDNTVLVVGMTTAHVAAAEHIVPDAASRCHVITEFTGDNPSRGIDDPIGQPVEVYRRCAAEIEAALPGIIAWIEEQREGTRE